MRKITVFPARRVITMDPGRPTAQAVAVMDGRVLSTGTLESMKPWLDRYPYDIDETLRDKIVMPGLIDPHTHFTISPGFLALHYVGPIDSPGPKGVNPGLPTRDDVLRKLRDIAAADSASKTPIIAWGLDPASQGGNLDRAVLDRINPNRPIFVITYAPHFVFLNSAAIALSNITEESNVHGVLRGPDGRLNGQFVEVEAMRLALGAMLGEIAKLGGADGLRRMGRIAQEAGITTTAELTFGVTSFEREWALYSAVVSQDDFPLRMGLVTLENAIHHSHGKGAIDFLKQAMRHNSDKLFLRGVKYLSDGSFPAMSLRANFPGYLDGGNGIRNDIPWDELHERMLPYWEADIPIHCHANGDEALDATLDALARLQQIRPRFDHRFTVEHYSISRPDQARRLKQLGGIASVNNYFVHFRSQLHSNAGYGPDRSEALARLASLEREDVTFALHSDFSLVLVPMHPLTAVWIAVNRIALDGKTVMAPGERISLDRALRAVTIDAAYVLGRERDLGSLEPGKLADFTVLEDDPHTVDPLNLKDIAIWGTALGGRLQPV